MALDAIIFIACSFVLYGINAQLGIPSTCNAPLTSSLRNDQFTASSQYNDQHNASAAKFNSSVGWVAGSYNNEYLKVSLDGVWLITALDFAGSNIGWYLNHLRVSYSLDGYHWKAYNTRFSEDILGQQFQRQASVTKVTLDPPIEVSYVAFYGTSAFGYPSIRLELYGCQISTTPFSGIVTHVTQDIQANTTWIPSQNPVIISGHVIVRPEVTLTVQAGVNVIFTLENARLDVFGTLVSEGLPGVRTQFSSNNPHLEKPSSWLGIKQGPGGNITLRYTTVRQAVACIQGNGSNIHISESEIYSCMQGLRFSGGISETQRENGWGPILSKTKVMYNDQGAQVHGTLGQEIIYFDSTRFDFNRNGIEVANWVNIDADTVSTIFFSTNVSMSNNTNYGLYIIVTPTVVNIRESTFIGNRNGGVYWYQYYSGNQGQAFNITDTTFQDSDYGISYSCYYCNPSNMTIVGGMFRHVNYAVYIIFRTRDDIAIARQNITIANNTFINNRRDVYMTLHSSEQSYIVRNSFSGSQEAITIQSDTSTASNILVTVADNSFDKLVRGYTAVSLSFVRTLISMNSFNNCSSATLISLQNGYDHLIAYNKFVNTTNSNCYVQTKEAYIPGKTIAASFNYWDTSDIFSVKSKVCDFFVDSSKAVIHVTVFYEDSSMTKLNSSKTIDIFRSDTNQTTNVTYIGGVVDDDVDISILGSSRFILNRSLLITEGVTVRLDGVILNITDGRGIVVIGSLVVGSNDTEKRTVIQKHAGTWNSIVLYNTALKVFNTKISGAVAAIDIKKSSSVYMHNCSANDGSMQSLIKADKPEQNVSVNISNCFLRVYSTVIDIVVNDSDLIDVNIEKSTITSIRNYIASITEGSSNRTPRRIRVSVISSHLENPYNGYGAVYIHGCSFLTELTIVDSTLASNRYQTVVNLRNPSINAYIHGNKFGDSRRDFYVEFCNTLTENPNQSGAFTIVNNIFNSSYDGEVFYVYDYHSGAMEHDFNFTNNTMVYEKPVARKFFTTNIYTYSEKHTLHFLSNTLVNSSQTLLEIQNRFRQITLKWNRFVNNTACLLYSTPPHTTDFLGFNIDKNEFQENSHKEGVIVISTEQFRNATVSLTNNHFIRNNGTSFSFRTSNVSIKYNFFENPNALYNMKVDNMLTLNDVRADINASLNYWGTSDPREIEKKLYDKSYDETLLDILYRPYLGSRNASDVRNEEIRFVNGNELGGNVNGNVTLYSDKSPYLVVTNVVVGENDSLTIQENVEIRVKADLGFTVLGNLSSQGTLLRPVRFISEDMSPWKGIEFNSYHGTGISITHLQVNNTKEGIILKSTKASLHDVTSTFSMAAGFHIIAKDNNEVVTDVSISKLIALNNVDGVTIDTGYNNSIVISNCIVSNNTADGIVTTSSGNVTISNCIIERNKARGIKLDMRTSGFIKITKSVIRSNSEYALEGHVTTGIEIDSSTISDHRIGYYSWGWRSHVHTHIQISDYNSKMTTVIIRNSNIINNTADGILVTSSYNNGGNVSLTVENNTFYIGNLTFEFDDQRYYWSSFVNKLTFANNTVSNYTENQRQQAFVKLRVRTYENIHLSQNRFENNSGFSAIRIEDIPGKGYANISSNTFVSNLFSVTAIDIPYATKLDLHMNVFETALNQSCTLQTPDFEISYTINATHNFWGSKNLSAIVNTICGFEKDMGRSYVSYIPYFEDNQLAYLASPENFNKSITYGAFGGEIIKNTQLSKSDFPMPIHIQRSIVIRPGVSLFVEPGVELRFYPNRGIYVQGSLKAIGEKSYVDLVNAIGGQFWYGLILNGTSSLEDDKTLLFNTNISSTTHGVIAYSPHFQVKGTVISNSSNDCFTIYQTVEKRVYSFESSVLVHCRNNGLFVNGIGSSIVTGLDVGNSTTGVKVLSSTGHIELRTVRISNISSDAVSITFSSSFESGNVSISNCVVSNCSRGVILDIQNYNTPNMITVTNNVFHNVSSESLHLKFSTYTYYNSNLNRSVDIAYNTFTNSCGILVNTWNVEKASFNNNIMKDSICNKKPECFMTMTSSGHASSNDNRIYEISTNVFENIQSRSCIVQILDSDLPRINGRFTYNQLIDNKATDGVILANAFYADLVENIFDNPASTFDVYTSLKGDRTLNVTKNWWGSSDGTKVLSRIFDQRRDPSFPRFNVTPTLTSRAMDCSDVNNCSKQGECVRKNTCRCMTGWTGSKCTDYDCAGVNNCYGNGICVGPNECECNPGWSGNLCIYASCSNVNDCSGHGFCVRPDTCTCAVSFTGSNCSSCVPFHFGPECRPCPYCTHGQCHLTTGVCVCDTDNWTGPLCDKCSEAFYGRDCLPLVTVLDVVPRQGLDKGGNTVHAWGHNFPKNSSYSCKFGNSITNGTWKAWDHIVCVAPKHAEGVVTVEISPDGVHFTNNKIMYAFFASCPPGSCGRNFDPPHGLCMFGECSCILPWHGDNCTKELLRPLIAHPPLQQTASEFEDYVLQLSLIQGDPPIRWVLLEGTKGLSLDERTGLVSWKSIPANINPYRVRVRASNAIGEDTVTWNISVPISYVPVVNASDPSGILPYPRPVQISGYIHFTSNVRMVAVEVVVTNNRAGRKTVLNEWSNPLKPNVFTTTYYPTADESGLFNVIARHPGSSVHLGPQYSWSVLGMQCLPSGVNVDETILRSDGTVTVYNISALLNVGEYTINNITIKIDGLADTFVRRHGDNDTSVAELAVLNPQEAVHFDLVIRNARPLYGTIYIVFATNQGTTTRLRIGIRLSVMKPVLSLLPNSISENIVRGTQRFFDINIKNIGEVAATNVGISLPNDPRLTLVSLSLVNSSTDSIIGDQLSIAPNGEAQMTLGVTIGTNAALGEFRGTIYVNSKLTSTPIQYEFFVTSLERFNLTFTVKDEYTYFAEGSPLVAGAKLILSNPRRQYAQTLYTTNETGYVVFENVYEDRYTLKAEAEGHGSYGAVIIASASETKRDIFLQRIAVKYTWTVTPTTVQDKYVIQLESTFETNVPMPVVTIEPSHINTIPYELGEKDTIIFNITNHGLIRADNVRFSLPEGHPFLKFETVIDDIGSVEANTSIIVPIKATLKTRRKRNIVAAVICGLAMLYDYDCGGLQTRSNEITLVRESPDGRPRPCGLTGGGGGGGLTGGGGTSSTGGGTNTGSGNSVEYSPTTPLSCDCAKTLIKSCALVYNPIIGCSYAITDLGLSYAKSGGDFILGTLNAILGLADTAFACVFGSICSLCGMLYTTVRCVIDAAYNCDGGRRRREIGSDVVNNLMQTTKPIDNFLQIMSEVLGDEAMFDLETSWFQTFKQTVADDTDLGQMLSESERTSIMNTVQNATSKAILSRFLERWNNTASAWDNGTLTELEDKSGVIGLSRLKPKIEQYITDAKAASAKGYANIFFQYDNASSVYQKAEKKESSEGGSKKDGVCASVRVRILQELVLTRDAFTARLEIENGENSDLQNIKVQIEIRQTYGSAKSYIDKFSFGKPKLVGITEVDGTGSLQKDTSGSAEWLIIPYSDAAPVDDTLYDVGGRLSYSVGGSEFSVPLLPDTITIKPNPSLIVHYFHEKYVQGDNPLTQIVEPVVPFSLAVMVMNKGYGIARALKITSGQPEIIENEKGLLVAFKIIGAQIGANPITPSMTVDFGDVSSSQTKTARWLMTSTLMGTFYNYSATFENINPLGDPQLSLLDDLGYHELLHLVRIENPDKDDGLDDFLVNDFIDDERIPDKLYNSNNGLDVMDVNHANVTNITVQSFVRSVNKPYTNITITVPTNASIWIYSRLENIFTTHEKLIYAEAEYEHRPLLLHKNVWQTTYIMDKTLIHLFDYVSNSSNASSEKEYKLTYGSENMYAPKFNMTSLFHEVRRDTPMGNTVLNLVTYDLDNDEVDVSMISHNTEFVLKKTSSLTASLWVATPLNPGIISIALMARDHGIPSRTSAVNISLTITDGINTTTPSFSSTSVTATTETTTAASNVTSALPTTVTSSESSTSTEPSTNATTPTTEYSTEESTQVSTTGDLSTTTGLNVFSSTSSETNTSSSSTTTDQITDGSTMASTTQDLSSTKYSTSANVSSSSTTSATNKTDNSFITTVSATTASTSDGISTTTTNIASSVPNQEGVFAFWIVPTAIGCAVGPLFFW